MENDVFSSITALLSVAGDGVSTESTERTGEADAPERTVSTASEEQTVSTASESGAGGEELALSAHLDSPERFLAQEEITPEDVLVETGFQPNEFLVALVCHHDGQVWQGDIVEETEWSESTVSRRLSQLESEGRLDRRQIGRRKLVYHPDQTPEAILTKHSR